MFSVFSFPFHLSRCGAAPVRGKPSLSSHRPRPPGGTRRGLLCLLPVMAFKTVKGPWVCRVRYTHDVGNAQGGCAAKCGLVNMNDLHTVSKLVARLAQCTNSDAPHTWCRI